MSVSNEINRLNTAKSDIIDAIEEKGVDIPSGATLDELADAILQIQTGGAVTSVNGQTGDVMIYAGQIIIWGEDD